MVYLCRGCFTCLLTLFVFKIFTNCFILPRSIIASWLFLLLLLMTASFTWQRMTPFHISQSTESFSYFKVICFILSVYVPGWTLVATRIWTIMVIRSKPEYLTESEFRSYPNFELAWTLLTRIFGHDVDSKPSECLTNLNIRINLDLNQAWDS